jgi:hypothetical protein
MTGLAVVELSSALLAVCTPWLVALIARRVAIDWAGVGTIPVRSMTRLRATTAVCAGAVILAVVTLAGSPWRLLFVALGFSAAAGSALKVLNEVDDLTRAARYVTAPVRAAGLTPRRFGEYVPWSCRLAIASGAVLGAATLVLRASEAAGSHRLFMPVIFAIAAPIFSWLYTVWAHQVISGPVVAADASHLRRIVRRIFTMEAVLVVVCLVTAHALLGFNWRANGALGAAIAVCGGAIAIAGCAVAIASGLIGRQYETVERT